MIPFTLPTESRRIQLVSSFEELVLTPFANGVNALCWQRTLTGDFSEIIEQLALGEGITTLDDDLLESLQLSASGSAARDHMLGDLRQLRDRGLDPVLDCINGYLRDENPGPVPTDVYSFHADSATAEADTFLCTYHGAASEGLENDGAQRRIDVPETRAELLKLYGEEDDADFAAYLNENCFDLHYVPVPPTQPFSFGIGNLWRIAVAWPGSPVPPCIHRAPETHPGQPPRLLLIS